MTFDAVARWRPSRQSRSPRTWRLAGLVASLALTAASWFCAAVPHEFRPVVWPGIEPWRPEGGSSLACSVAVLATGVLVYAWWAVRDLGLDAGWVRTTVVAWCGPLLLSAPLFSRDVYSYAVQGLMLHEGLDPYTQGVRVLDSPWVGSVSRVWLDTPAPYGPVFLLLARGCAAVSGGHLLVAVALLRLLAALAVGILAWAVPTVATRLGADRRGAAAATWLAVLTPIVGGHLVSGVHNDALMTAGIVAAVALALSGRHAAAVVVIALAAAVKAPAAVVVPFLSVLWAAASPQPPTTVRLVLRAVAHAVTTALVFVGISLASGLGFAWVGALGTPGLSSNWTAVSTSWGTVVGWLGALTGLGGPGLEDHATAVARLVAYGVLAVLLLVTWVDAVRHATDRRRVVRDAGLAVLALVVLSPSFYAWYLLWALPLLAASLRSRRGLTSLGLVAALLAFSALPGGYGLALSTTSTGAPLMVVASLVAAVIAVRWLLARWRDRSPAAAPHGG